MFDGTRGDAQDVTRRYSRDDFCNRCKMLCMDTYVSTCTFSLAWSVAKRPCSDLWRPLQVEGKTKTIHEFTQYTCWRAPNRPLSLALLNSEFEQFILKVNNSFRFHKSDGLLMVLKREQVTAP